MNGTATVLLAHKQVSAPHRRGNGGFGRARALPARFCGRTCRPTPGPQCRLGTKGAEQRRTDCFRELRCPLVARPRRASAAARRGGTQQSSRRPSALPAREKMSGASGRAAREHVGQVGHALPVAGHEKRSYWLPFQHITSPTKKTPSCARSQRGKSMSYTREQELCGVVPAQRTRNRGWNSRFRRVRLACQLLRSAARTGRRTIFSRSAVVPWYCPARQRRGNASCGMGWSAPQTVRRRGLGQNVTTLAPLISGKYRLERSKPFRTRSDQPLRAQVVRNLNHPVGNHELALPKLLRRIDAPPSTPTAPSFLCGRLVLRLLNSSTLRVRCRLGS